jgi:hypothetical protein
MPVKPIRLAMAVLVLQRDRMGQRPWVSDALELLNRIAAENQRRHRATNCHGTTPLRRHSLWWLTYPELHTWQYGDSKGLPSCFLIAAPRHPSLRVAEPNEGGRAADQINRDEA